MKEIERLIEAAKELDEARGTDMYAIVGKDDGGHPVNREGMATINLRKAINAAESMLKRAKVFEGKAHCGCEGRTMPTPKFARWMIDNIPRNKSIYVLIIEEANNAGK